MAFVFKNYKPTKTQHDELVQIKILEGEDVFIELPVAIAEFGREYEFPVVFGDYKGLPKIMDAMDVLEHTKLFHFKEGAEDETKTKPLLEVSKNEATISIRLPKDVNVEHLISLDGQILLAEPQPK